MKRYNKGLMILIGLIVSVSGLAFVQCNGGKEGQSQQERMQEKTKSIAYYTCPMHPQIKMDEPGRCPICGMDLVPVHQEKEEKSAPTQDSSGIEIDSGYTQRIGVKTVPVKRQPLTRTVLAAAKVAHDPDLWVAQHEYLQALALGDQSLIKASELKLSFLGLSPEWIEKLRKEREATLSLHLPSDHSEYIEAYLYPADAEGVRPGIPAKIYDERGSLIQTGEVVSVSSVLDMETRTLRALVKTKEVVALRPNRFVQVALDVPAGKDVLAVPKSAILFNGDHNMVYVIADAGHYLPKTIELGASNADYYEVVGGLQEGERVVTNGHFLIDAETQIRTGGMSGHQH